jgi:malate permease and related proteins
VALPALILNGIFQVDINQKFLNLMLLTFICSVGLHSVGTFISWFILRMFPQTKSRRSEMALLSAVGNTGFIGIPLCAVLFGPKGALLAAVYDAGMDFFIWSVGVLMLQKKKKFQFRTLKELINIPMIAIVVGLLLAVFNFHPHEVITQSISSLANLATPLAMLYIGMLSSTLLTKIQWPLLSISFPIMIKLFIIPLLIGLFLTISVFPSEAVRVIAIQATMPCFTLAPILFARYGRDEEYGGAITVISTFISMITIPLMAPFVMSLLSK